MLAWVEDRRVLFMNLATKKSNECKKGKEFVWTDSEAELLLNVSIDYKTSKTAECVDWESIKSKYDDITELYIAALPDHKREQVTKLIVS